MEATKLGSPDGRYPPKGDASAPDESFSWRVLFRLIHPFVWALIATLWIGLLCLILYEAG